MAERRMFAKSVIDSDLFLDMPATTQVLYFHLAMRADDDGFVNNPKKIMRIVGAKDDDMKLLIAKQFILLFDSGIIVVKHWRIHNYIQKDRRKETLYQDEKNMLTTDQTGAYAMMDTACIQSASSLDSQVSIGEDSSGKAREAKAKSVRFTPPTLDEVRAYCEEIGASINPEAFVDYYTQIGWICGKAGKPMKDWKSAVRNWNRREGGRKQPQQEQPEKRKSFFDLACEMEEESGSSLML